MEIFDILACMQNSSLSAQNFGKQVAKHKLDVKRLDIGQQQ